MRPELEAAIRVALKDAISEFRALVQELSVKERRFETVRWAIVSLSLGINEVVPKDVLLASDKRRTLVQRAVERAAEK